MAWAHLEPIVSILRTYDDGVEYGGKYTWCSTVRWIDHETVEVCGAMRAPTAREWRALHAMFRDLNVRTVIIKRIREDGKTETRRVHIGKKRSRSDGIERWPAI